MKSIKLTVTLLTISVCITQLSFAQWSENASSIYPTNADKKVGIGTTDPGTKLEVKGAATFGKTYFNVLKIGPLESSPAYFYIDTKIPFVDVVAPQIHITGYNYGNPNKAVKLTIGWYEYANNFYWAQYKSDLGYYNPSRIRLGTYDDAGTKRVRIEIANDGTYWSSYFISATDHGGLSTYYNDWSFTLGNFPAIGTGDIITVSEYAGMVYSNAGNVGIGTATPLSNLNNNGLHISKGDHSMLLLGEPKLNSYGGVVQTSDNKHRIFIGANLYDDPNLSWKNFQAGKGGAGISVMADYGGWGTSIDFYTSNKDNELLERMTINGNGNIGVGTNTPTEKLTVNGNIKAKKVIVTQAGWADYVFDKNYNLMSLQDLSKYIEQHKHLPEILSAKEIESNGVDVGTNQALLLKKIEELTLYIIGQHKAMNEQQKQIVTQHNQIKILTQTVEQLKQKIKD